MAEEKNVEQKELTLQEKLAQVNAQLENLRLTEQACNEIVKDKQIKILNLADKSDDPVSLTISGDTVHSIIRPVVQSTINNRNQLVSMKEQILGAIEQQMSAEVKK